MGKIRSMKGGISSKTRQKIKSTKTPRSDSYRAFREFLRMARQGRINFKDPRNDAVVSLDRVILRITKPAQMRRFYYKLVQSALQQGHKKAAAQKVATSALAGALHRHIVYPEELLPTDKDTPMRHAHQKLNARMLREVHIVELWLKTMPFLRTQVAQIQKEPVYLTLSIRGKDGVVRSNPINLNPGSQPKYHYRPRSD